MAIDTIWEKAPYVNQAAFSPDGKQLLVAGAGDAFDGSDEISSKDRSPTRTTGSYSYTIWQAVKPPLTKDFNPNVIDAVWNRFNGQNLYPL